MNTGEWRRRLADLCAEFGARMEQTRSKHVTIFLPNGERVTAPGTPSDYRSWLNTRAQVRRAAKKENV